MTGGGTLGPATPLITIAQEWKKREPAVHVSWIGTPKGPERTIVENAGYTFYSLRAPKFHRHRKWLWPFVPFLMLLSCMKAYKLLKKLRPEIIFSAGGYVSVPIVWMGKVLGIPSWIHQLDVKPGIANKAMAPVAKRISVTWLDSLEEFPEKKTRQVGSLVRADIGHGDRRTVMERHHLDGDKPTLFVVGGGTGAQSINEVMEAIGPEIVKRANVIHITGYGKMTVGLEKIHERYVALEFLQKMDDYYAAADVVISRAGMGTILELAALKKPTILIPNANADQVANATRFEDANAGAVIYRINGQILKQEIERLFLDVDRQDEYADNISDLFIPHGEERIVREAMELIEH